MTFRILVITGRFLVLGNNCHWLTSCLTHRIAAKQFLPYKHILIPWVYPERRNQDKVAVRNLAGDSPVNFLKAVYMADLDLNPESWPIASMVK